MLYYEFGNYEGFKELFGVRECGNGEKARRNKILLSYVKQRRLVHDAVFKGETGRINLRTMDALWRVVERELQWASSGSFYWSLCGVIVFSNKYQMDDYRGICEDGDTRSIRYVNAENGRVFKMKSGKFMRRLFDDSGLTAKLPEQVVVWFCEDFATKWQAYATGKVCSCTLHVERSYEAFEKIYDRDAASCDFHSCMNNQGNHGFYMDAVDAKAAWLENAEGKVAARCVIYNDVEDEDTGEQLRLAERQYAESDMMKRLLVDKLIAAGEIDGYKRVGADCHSSHAFVSNNGDDWSDRNFSIGCNLDYGEALSYQDSFKWYDMSERKAYNDSGYDYDAELDTTSGRIEGGNYDEWHEEYTTSDLQTVYYHGRAYNIAEDNMDEFVYVDAGEGQWEYHYEDDVTYCVDIDGYVLSDEAHYSDLLGDDYYDIDEMRDAEWAYKERNWYWSEYDDEYYEDEDDVVKLHLADGSETTISVESAERDFEFEVRDGEYYEIVKEEEAA